MQRSGYQRCLSVPSDLLMGRRTDHFKSSDPKASALLLAPGSARSHQVTPAHSCMDTAGHRLRRGQTRRDQGCACLRTCVCDRCADTWTRLRPPPHGGCCAHRYTYKVSQIFVRIHQTPLQSPVTSFTPFQPLHTKEQLDASQGGL